MALYIASLNSGSNGNCYYIGNNTDAVLIDVGISCREVEKRLKQLDLQVKKIKAIFISHEHGDHIKGVTTFANKHKLPVYITDATAKQGIHLIRHLSKSFSATIPVTIGELSVTAFSKYHDAIDPHSFIINYSGITVGVFTDIGKVCKEVVANFKQCHAVFLEANYDEAMLENGRYPLHLKNRIRGGNGHLSNNQALQLFTKHKPPFLSHLILSHLSKENNSPEIVENLFAAYAGETAIYIASRNQASSVFSISGNMQTALLQVQHPVQLNLFA
jgi:phosphoribosyl 1,2-cyclic phosphodiesterase